MEQASRFDAIMALKQPSTGWLPAPFIVVATVDIPEFTVAFCGKVPMFVCPSDPSGDTSYHRNNMRSNYVFSVGESAGYGESYNRWTNDTSLSTYPYQYVHHECRGVFGALQWYSFGGISDGSSNTIGMSESVASPAPASNAVKGGVIVPTTTPVEIRNNPSICAATKGPGNTLINGTAYPNGNSANVLGRGHAAFSGLPVTTTFNTILPPNSPSCMEALAATNWGIFAASSMHTGGVNVMLMDGSVQFVSDTVNAGNNTLPRLFSGPSNFGVWGAMGTRNGGESKSL